MRTTHSTPLTLHMPLAMDAMRPCQAFGAPPAPSALDPRRWFGVVGARLAGVAARIVGPDATTGAPTVGAVGAEP